MKQFLLLFLLVCNDANSQIQFNSSRPNPIDSPIENGLSMGVADINGDLFDDIIAFDQGKDLWIGYQTGSKKWIWKSLGRVLTQPSWSLCVGDMDRNGLNDIIIGGDYEGIIIFYQENSGFTKSIIPESKFFTQGSTLSDLNNDGYLDIVVCDDNAKPRIYKNLMNRVFVRDTSLIDFSINPVLGEAGNYSVAIIDIDGDNDQDVYLSKCRGITTDPKDLRRVNRLYINQDGNFIENAKEYNLDDGSQSWTTDFGDIDNDGDLDAIILNHGSSSFLMENIDNKKFVNINGSSGFEIGGTPIQALFRDFDNDDDLDILISGSEAIIFENLGNNKFIKKNQLFGEIGFASFAVGDLNSDGFLDIYSAYPELLNDPRVTSNTLWLNNQNQNHYIDLVLKGEQSNPNAIGAKAWIFVKDKLQMRQLSAGESYGIQNSHSLHFGLSNDTLIDSLIIQWPNGKRSLFQSLSADHRYLVTENNCVKLQNKISIIGTTQFCNGDSVILSSEPNLKNVVWNDNNTDSIRTFKSDQFLFYKANNDDGCPVVSESVLIEVNPIEHPKLNISGEKALCGNQQIELNIDEFKKLIWSTLDTSPNLILINSGLYFAKVSGLCQSFYTDTLDFKQLSNPIKPQFSEIKLSKPDKVNLTANGDNLRWYINKDDISPFYRGNAFVTDSIHHDTTFWVESNSIHVFKSIHGGELYPKFQDIEKYHPEDINAKISFDVFEPCILNSITVFSDIKGLREFQLINDQGKVIDSVQINITSYESQIPLFFNLIKGSYSISTNPMINHINLGTESPKLVSSNKEVFYPYNISKYLRISGSSRGINAYDYFFNWEIREPDLICSSERIEAKISFVTQASELNKNDLIYIYPNPSKSDVLSIHSPLTTPGKMTVYNLDGKLIITTKIDHNNNNIDVSNIQAGIYNIKIVQGRKSWFVKWIKF